MLKNSSIQAQILVSIKCVVFIYIQIWLRFFFASNDLIEIEPEWLWTGIVYSEY